MQTVSNVLRHGSHIFTCKLHHACLYSPAAEHHRPLAATISITIAACMQKSRRVQHNHVRTRPEVVPEAGLGRSVVRAAASELHRTLASHWTRYQRCQASDRRLRLMLVLTVVTWLTTTETWQPTTERWRHLANLPTCTASKDNSDQ